MPYNWRLAQFQADLDAYNDPGGAGTSGPREVDATGRPRKRRERGTIMGAVAGTDRGVEWERETGGSGGDYERHTARL